MSFNFGATPVTPKTATGFTLPSSTPAAATTLAGANPAGGFAFNLTAGSGDSKPASALFSTPFKPASTTAAAPATGLNFGLGQPAKTTTSSLSFGTLNAPTSQPATATSLGFNLGASVASSAPTSTATSGLQFNFGGPATQTATTTTSTTSFTPILGSTTTTASSTPASGLTFGTPTTTATAPKSLLGASSVAATTPSTGFSLGGTTTIASTATTTTTAGVPSSSSINFTQLEDSINKWTIDLEEQSKFFINQAKQLNAWDTLLISNGEKILNLNSSIKRVKQQQTQLDQELDFILAQQKELEELIVPLEKELMDIPVTDNERNQMYQFSELIDSQLKQILDDLKEIIENINESNKDEEGTNPITQISKILNAHMNSLQWIDRNTNQISRHLEEISKIEEDSKRSLNLSNSFSMFQ